MRLKPIHKGDRIAISAPAGPFDRRRFGRGIRALRDSGFQVTHSTSIFSENRKLPYLAGDDGRRAGEINRALKDPKIRAVLFARGGYGCQRILPRLKVSFPAKILVGSSDLTALLNTVWQRSRLPSLYGPMVTPHLGDPKNVRRLIRALTDPLFFRRQPLLAAKVIRPGRAEGTLVGGCLSLVVALLGTPWEILTDGTILFLEDTDEPPYAVDRMLTQLEQAGKFRRVKGIIFGTFRLKKKLFPIEVEKVIRDKFRGFPRPVLWGVRFGHCREPLIVPIGGKGRIKGKELVITRGLF